MKCNCSIASECSTMRQNHALVGFFLIGECFRAENVCYSYRKYKNVSPETTATYPKLLANNTFKVLLANNFGEYINKGLNKEQLPVLRHKYTQKHFCLSHTLNGCCAKRASNLNAKVGLFTLSGPWTTFKV